MISFRRELGVVVVMVMGFISLLVSKLRRRGPNNKNNKKKQTKGGRRAGQQRNSRNGLGAVTISGRFRDTPER